MLREILPNDPQPPHYCGGSGHFFARLRERPPLAPGQAPEAAARNFFQDGIDFLGDEFVERHLPAAFALDSSPSQRALHKRRPAEAEQMRVEPADGTAARESAVTDHTAAIEDDQQEADREKGVAEIFRLQFYRQNEEERLGQLQLRQNRRKSHDHRGDPARGRKQHGRRGHEEEVARASPPTSADEVKIEKMSLPEDRLHVAADEVEHDILPAKLKTPACRNIAVKNCQA